MTISTFNVLFLCNENAGRSLMAEAMLNKLGHGRFKAYSAGINPADKANSIALEHLRADGYNTDKLTPKHYSVFLKDDAPNLDFVFTLCADTEQEAKLNIWDELSNNVITAHWHFNDPHDNNKGNDKVTENEDYSHVERELSQRLRLLLNLPDDKLKNLSNNHKT